MKKICVAHIINSYQLALNIGEGQGAALGQRYQIYALSDNEIIDPLTHESLGFLEIVKGSGIVISLQKHMCIIESDMKTHNRTKVIRKSPAYMQQMEEYFDSDDQPFDNPKVGDLAKLVD